MKKLSERFHNRSQSRIAKVKKILKGSLDLIQSLSPSIQIVGRKVYLMGKGKTFLVIVNKLFVSK